MKRILSAFGVLALLIPAAALAYPVQEFSAGVKDIKPGGRFTFVYSSRTYDSSGGVPDAMRASGVGDAGFGTGLRRDSVSTARA